MIDQDMSTRARVVKRRKTLKKVSMGTHTYKSWASSQ